MKKIERIRALLERAYGHPECHPKREPLDELILTVLSQNTSSVNCNRAFANLRTTYASWDEVVSADVDEIEDAIRAGGLGATKAARIKAILESMSKFNGGLSLDCLRHMTDREAMSFLRQFKGIGPKTAACVLMFSLCRHVFPVDTHVHRLARRLGLIGVKVSAERAHDVLGGMVPPGSAYSLHVNMVNHGRLVCKARNPSCGACSLLEMCPSGQARLDQGDLRGTA